MKKLHLFKRTLLLLALIVGFVNYGWADEITYTFNSNSWGATTGGSAANWTSGKDGNIYNNGIQVTTGTTGANGTSPISFSNVSKVTVNYHTNKNAGVGTISVKIGTGTAKSFSVTKPATDQGLVSKSHDFDFSNETGKVNILVACATNSIYIESVTITYSTAPAYTITAQSNNNSYGTVSLSGSVITGSPNSGYRYASPAYTVSPANSATVSQNGDNFTVTPTENTTVTINFEAIPTYTVTFDAEGGSCGTTSTTETIGGAGVTLPAATIDLAGWVFAGWATAPTASTPTRPTLYKSGSPYYPTANTTLHAVYTLDGVNYEKYQRATTLDQIISANQIAIVNASKILDNKLGGVSAPEETDGFIDEPSSDYIWTLSGDNTDGFTLTNGGKTISTAATLPSTSGNLQLSSNHNNWLFVESTYGTNNFVVRNKELNSDSKVGSIDYNSGWKIYFLSSAGYAGNSYVASKIYVPVSTVFNSTPTQAIITPVVSFNSSDAKTLYLDGTTTYTNAASVTKVAKPVTGYRSSDEDVATVAADGTVTAVGIGTATITAYLDAELGVHKAAQATYDVVVKTTTTIAGLKAIDNSKGVAFAADLTNAVVTYVAGDYAYIQDESAAILVNKSEHGLVAGQKINGAVSGTVKITNSIDQLTAIDLSSATVTEDGAIPAALTKTVAEVRANAASLDGQLVTINAVTVDKPSTTTTLKDGSKIEEVDATITMYSPNSRASVNDKERGNFTGFVSLYNGDTPRINLYDQIQFTKTHNAPTAQTLSFDEDDVNLDEDTEALANYVGQAVNGAHTTLTWEVDGASDDIVQSIDAATGALVLNGACGAAIINVSAVAADVEDAGVITPYLAANTSYTITVNPRYMVTFSVNGVETVLRQATSGASINVPTPAAVGDYKFRGWSTSTVAPIDEEPSMASVGAKITPANNDTKYYAVFAKGTAGGEDDVTSTFTIQRSSALSSPYENNNVSWSHNNVKFDTSNTCGMPSGASITITLPENSVSTKSITLTGAGGEWSGSTKAYVNLKAGETQLYKFDKDNLSYDFESNYRTFTLSSDGSKGCWISQIEVEYTVVGITYSDYRTSLPTVEVTITDAKYATFCYARELNVEGTGVTAYTASANGEGKAVTLTKISDNIIPANTGVILFAETADNYVINVSTTGKEAIAGNELVGVTTRTQIPETSADKYNYIFSKKDEKIGFYRASGAYLLPNHAYLSTSKRNAAAREFMAIMFDEGETTAISEVRGLKSDVRGEFYNLNGQRVAQPSKGLYIVNGKKVMFK